MEFLYKLYDNEYFGIGLFIVIAILIFLFLLILFFGKKDEKKRKLEETKKLELENTNAFKESNDTVEALNIPEIEQPVINESVVSENKDQELNKSDEILFNIPKLEEPVLQSATTQQPTVAPTNEVVEQSVSEINEDVKASDDVQKPIEDININELFQTNLNELPKEAIVEEVKNEDIVLPKVEAPFSSVYVNNKEEKVEQEEKKNINPIMFELPKRVDEVKKEEEVKVDNSNNVEVEKISDFDSLFGDIEAETYDLNK